MLRRLSRLELERANHAQSVVSHYTLHLILLPSFSPISSVSPVLCGIESPLSCFYCSLWLKTYSPQPSCFSCSLWQTAAGSIDVLAPLLSTQTKVMSVENTISSSRDSI